MSVEGDVFLFQVTSVFVITGRGMVLAGRMEKGAVRVGARVQLRAPGGFIETTIVSIEKARSIVSSGSAGEELAFLIRGVEPSALIGGVERDKTSGAWQVVSLQVVSVPKRWWEFWR